MPNARKLYTTKVVEDIAECCNTSQAADIVRLFCKVYPDGGGMLELLQLRQYYRSYERRAAIVVTAFEHFAADFGVT